MNDTIHSGAPQEGAEEPSDIAWSDMPRIVASGFCMGTADIVPGVSGGTMAVALGIYRQFLAAITSIDVRAMQALLRLNLAGALSLVHWRFLGGLGFGIALAIAIMVKVVGLPHLIEDSPKYVYAVFFGLVLASTVVLARRLPSWNAARWVWLAGGAMAGWLVVSQVPVETPNSALFVFVSGAISICAMLLPGISGSFVLLILGKYAYVLGALSELDFSVILPFALGAASGLIAFSRVLNWALTRFHDTMIAALTGLLIGSLWRIWPYQELTTIIVRDKPRVVGAVPFVPDTPELSVLALGVAGLVAVLALERFASARKA